MKKRILNTIILLLLVTICIQLILSCSNEKVGATSASASNHTKEAEKPAKPQRFFDWKIDAIYGMTDGLTGCQYVRAPSGNSSYTYLHGTCPDVIAKESGK